MCMQISQSNLKSWLGVNDVATMQDLGIFVYVFLQDIAINDVAP